MAFHNRYSLTNTLCGRWRRALAVNPLFRLLKLQGEQEVQDTADKGRNGEPRFHDQDYGIEETPKRLVVPLVREDVGEVGWYESGTVAEGEAGSQNESVSAVESNAFRYDGDARDGHCAESAFIPC